jgi:Flp pilus assembly protein TadB
MDIITAILGPVWPYLAAAGAAVLAIAGAYWQGARSQRQRHALDKAKRTAATHKEMREHEREASELDDTSLADRITRKR